MGARSLPDIVPYRGSGGYPKLDVLMNNAGIMLHKNLNIPAADLGALMAEVNINVGGVIRMTSALVDVLAANKGTIINVSSALAFVPLPSAPIYSAPRRQFTLTPSHFAFSWRKLALRSSTLCHRQ